MKIIKIRMEIYEVEIKKMIQKIKLRDGSLKANKMLKLAKEETCLK